MAEFKQELLATMRNEELNNKKCIDCNSPNPQWTSISHATLICLTCAGVHRGLGVHISFVRSMTMDTFSPDQMKRMRLGGNQPFTEFITSYTPADQGGYTEGLSIADKYSCWAVKQYKEKLDASVGGKDWSPSAPPAGQAMGIPARPSSAQGLRKSRQASRNQTASPLSRDSVSQAMSGDGSTDDSLDQKTANERYFSNLGEANANRPDDLPPSQGGRYAGFGSTPAPPPPSSHPSFGLSSGAAPSLADFQNDPVSALSKGWSLFSTAVVGATKTVTENVLDPAFAPGVKGYVSDASKKATEVAKTANRWTEQQIGVNVAQQVGGVYGTVKDAAFGGHPGGGYGALSSHPGYEEHNILYSGDDEEDFFEREAEGGSYGSPHAGGSASQQTKGASGGASAPKKDDDWGKQDDWDKDGGWGKEDEWKSF